MSEELQELMDNNPEWYKDILLVDAKEFIRANINSASRSFVAIGYYLKYIRNNEMFTEDGYQSIWEFAQAEFGIGKSSASQYMSINDKFSKDSNSPVLLEKYKDFSSSKLSEMLTMTEEQLDEITPATTIVEIRQIKKPVKPAPEVIQETVLTSEQPEPKKPYYECAAYRQHEYSTGCKDCFYDKTDCPYDRTKYFEELKRKKEWGIHCEVLKEMCNSICKMSSYILEKNNYSMETIKGLSQKDQDFSFGFGDDGTGHSKYSAWYKAKTNRYQVEEFHGEGKWMFEAGEVDQDIWNFNSRIWKENRESAKYEPVPIDDLELSVRTYNCLKRADIDMVDQLCKLTETDVIKIRNISQKCLDEIKLKLSGIGRSLKPDEIPEIANDVDESVECSRCKLNGNTDAGILECHPEKGEHKCFSGPEGPDENEADYIETVTADIIQTVQEEVKQGTNYSINAVYSIFLKAKSDYEEVIKVGGAPDNLVEKRLIIRDALLDYYQELRGRDTAWYQKPQPELPILKNNDQRKEWAENYKAWGEWYYDEHVDCYYYKYDFPNGDRLVVEEYRDREFYWKVGTHDEQYYHLLQKNKEAYGSKRTYEKKYDHTTSSMSEITDYLKDFQKK